jgi:putative transcriptional regulator
MSTEIPFPNVREIRESLGMTQKEFADTYGFSVGAVRHWEQGVRKPEKATRLMLHMIVLEPRAVKRTLKRFETAA